MEGSGYRLQLLSFLLLVLCGIAMSGCGGGPVVSGLSKVERRVGGLHRRSVKALERNDYRMALAYMRESLRLHRSVDDRHGEALDLINIGRVSLKIGRYGDAENMFEEALRLAVTLNDTVKISEATASLGKLRILQHDYGEAIDRLTSAVKMDKDERYAGLGTHLNLLGIAYRHSERYEDSKRTFKEAMEVNERSGKKEELANSYRNLANLLFEHGELKEAERRYREALDIDSRLERGEKIAEDLLGLYEVYYASEDIESAEDSLKRAYKVHLNGGFYRRALRDIDKLISLYKTKGDQVSVDIYSSEKERILGVIGGNR